MLSSGTEAEHYPAIALRLFEEARDRPFCWMVCFGVSVVVSIKTSDFSEFQGILSQVRGEGRYTFSAIMFMPASAETATIQFEQLTPSNSFLHLDLSSARRRVCRRLRHP